MAIDIEAIIKAAIKKGEFDDFQGKGEPLKRDEFENVPEEIRMTYRILKNANVVPTEVNMKNLIDQLKLALEETNDEVEKSELRRKIQKLETEFQIKLERMKK